MKTAQRKSERALCPYYHKHDTTGVYCDSLVGGASSKENMMTSDAADRLMAGNCFDKWELCPKAAALREQGVTAANITQAMKACIQKELERRHD